MAYLRDFLYLDNKQEHIPQTRGRTIGWARPYDLLVNLLLLGKEHALRENDSNNGGY